MSKINVSTAQVGLPVQWVSATQPIDDRSAVQNRSDLLDDVTWQRNGSGPAFVYSGMLTAVVSDNDSNNNGIYYLAKRGNRNDQSWDVNGVDSNSISNYNVNGWRKLLDNTSVLQPTAYNLSISYNNTLTPIYNPFTSAASIVLGNNIRYNQAQIDSEFINNIQVMDGSTLSADMTSSSYTIQNLDQSLIDSSAMYMLVTSTFGNRRAYTIPAWSSGSGSYSGITTLGGLTDVTLYGSQDGDVLTYNNGMWVNQAITIPTVPTNVSAFTNDANYITSADIPAQVNADWNATSGVAEILNKPTLFSGNYNDLTNTPTIPTIPTNISYFVNDAGYITSAQIPSSSLFVCQYDGQNRTMLNQVSTQDIINANNNGQLVICEYNEITYYLSEHVESSQGIVDEILFIGFKQGSPKQSFCWIQYKSGAGWSNGDNTFINVQADWYQSDTTADDFIKNKPSLATVATTGNYNDLTNRPVIPTVPTNISSFNNDVGYLTNQDQSDWAETDNASPSYIKSKPNLATVATTGDYNDLLNTPTIPTIPSNVSYFTNDAGYLTQNDLNDLNVFVCNYNTVTGIMDKTAAEIATAHASGKTVLCRIYNDQNSQSEFMVAYLAEGGDQSHIIFTGLRIVNRQITTLSRNSNGWTLAEIPLDDSNVISQLANSEIWSVNTDASSGTGITISVGGRTKCILFDQTGNRDSIAISFSPENGYYMDFVWSPNSTPTRYPIIPGEKCTLLKARFINSNTLYYELIEMHEAPETH